MALYVVATPIGNPRDITLRALDILRNSTTIIGEEYRVVTTLLKSWDIPKPNLQLLNEHTPPEELKELVHLCKDQQVALVSDCGTPGFCDPGADLVRECRKHNIEIKSVPGVSSLTCFLSLIGLRLDQFVFEGFLPARGEEREQAHMRIAKESRGMLIMDTPYRLEKLLTEFKQHQTHRKMILGLNLSSDNEQILEGNASEIEKQLKEKKAEFMLLLKPHECEDASFSNRARKISKKKYRSKP
ncbi:MAG: methyltransferase [Bdellovibrionales bacterium]|nr:methyltransferase [Bdellovibrionales bacterium]